MAKLTKNEKYIVEMYVRYFGKAPTKAQIDEYAEVGKPKEILKQITGDANDANPSNITYYDYIDSIFQNLFGRPASGPEKTKYAKTYDKKGDLPINSIVKSAKKSDKDVYKNKILVAAKYAELGGKDDLDLSKISKGNLIDLNFLNTVTKAADLKAEIVALPENSGVPSAFDGKPYILTTSVDTVKDFTGTNKNDLFLSSSTSHWSIGDSIDGGKGVDTLKIIDSGAITQADVIPTGSTIKNIEILDVISGGTVEADTTSIDGLTLLNITSKTTAAAGATNNSAIASATTDIKVTDTNADTTDNINTITVDGGKDVTVVSKNNGTGDITSVKDNITVGGTTAAAGTVTTVINDGYVDASAAAQATTYLGNTAITGGTKINASSKVEFTAAQITAAKAIATSDTVAQGSVTVNGNASTTEVTVSQTAAQAAVNAAPGVDGQIGITAGAVTINDVNKGDNTKAGTIETVTVKNAAAVTVDSGALKTLNLEGTITSVNANSAGSKATVDTLALNLNGVDMSGTAAIDTDVKTLNVKSSTNASTISTAITTSATAINISGDAALTLATLTLGAAAGNEVITVTNTAGVTIGNALDTDVTFTGGAGADSVELSNNFTKAITMGAGNDKVTIGGTGIGTGGSVAAGEGKDTIVMSAANAAAFDDNSTFNTKFTGFEVLELSAITNVAINLTGINAVSTVNLAAGVGAALTLDNLASNGTVRITGNATAALNIGVKDALLTNTDVLNLELFSTTGLTTAAASAGVVTAANVETININVADADTAGSDAVTHALELAATSATSIVVAGNNGLTLTNTGNTKVTNFDASKVVANDTVATASAAATTDTAANLAVTFTSQNTDVAANVSIKGGAGNDVLTGSVSIDTITGGAGNDTLAGAAGADIINVGEGRDAILINSFATGALAGTDSGTASFDTINGFKLASAFTSTDIATFAKFQGTTVGGANASVLAIDMDADSANANQAINVEGNATGAGQAAGVTYTIKDGILTLSGVGASTVDTLGEWLVEAAAVAAIDGDILAFEFGSDTYVFGQNGNADVFVKLAGVTGVAALAEGGAASTGVDNTLWFVDIA